MLWEDKPEESRCEFQKQTNELKGRAEVSKNAKSKHNFFNYSVDYQKKAFMYPSIVLFLVIIFNGNVSSQIPMQQPVGIY